jgi:predicted metal-binding protein
MKVRRSRPPVASFVGRAVALGAKSAKVVKASSIATGAWVRWKCRYGCGGYGGSLCCPPDTPTPSETREVIDCYARAVLFEAGRGDAKRVAAKLEREVFLAGYYRAFGLGSGPCRLCREACAFAEGCRHPEEARPSMEACGIDVYATARANGFAIEVVRNRKDPQHYFGVVLVE